MRSNSQRRLRRQVAKRAGCEEPPAEGICGRMAGTTCAYCGVPVTVIWTLGREPVFDVVHRYFDGSSPDGQFILSAGRAHLDHIIPESRNGPTSLDNTVIACADCNIAKGDSCLGDPGFLAWLDRRREEVRRWGIAERLSTVHTA